MDFFIDIFNSLASVVLSLLPQSPFRPIIDWFADLPFLGFLNWIFPVKACLTIGGLWLTSIAIFYLYSVVMRWVKLIS